MPGGQDLSKMRKVPTFYAGNPDTQHLVIVDLIAAVIAIVFGGIQCIAWSFLFPSHIERLLWRITSCIVTSVPLIGALCFPLLLMVDWAETVSSIIQIPLKILLVSSIIIGLVGIPVYIVARLILLVLAFTTLRSLPPGAYETVYWTTFIPHF